MRGQVDKGKENRYCLLVSFMDNFLQELILCRTCETVYEQVKHKLLQQTAGEVLIRGVSQ